MNAFSKVLVAGLLGLVALSDSASACGNRYHTNYIRVVPQFRPVPMPPQFPQQPLPPAPIPEPPAPAPNGVGFNDTVINDLPVDAKRAIRAAAAKVRASDPSRPKTVLIIRSTR